MFARFYAALRQLFAAATSEDDPYLLAYEADEKVLRHGGHALTAGLTP